MFANAHTYHINSVSVNSDQETFLSADDLRVNLWHLDVPGASFNIVDIKPPNMEDLTEVITSAEFHPRACNIFAYASSKGCIRLADMRDAALCDRHAKAFEETDSTVRACAGGGGVYRAVWVGRGVRACVLHARRPLSPVTRARRLSGRRHQKSAPPVSSKHTHHTTTKTTHTTNQPNNTRHTTKTPPR